MGRLGHLHQQRQRDAEPCRSCASSPGTRPDVKIRIRRLTISRQPRFDDASLTTVASILDPGSVRVTSPSVVYLPPALLPNPLRASYPSPSPLPVYRIFVAIDTRSGMCAIALPSVVVARTALRTRTLVSPSIRSSCFVDPRPSISLLYISMYPPAQPKVRRRSVTNMYSYRTY